jgi:hypothetical protein
MTSSFTFGKLYSEHFANWQVTFFCGVVVSDQSLLIEGNRLWETASGRRKRAQE